jgi:hypothetical protein
MNKVKIYTVFKTKEQYITNMSNILPIFTGLQLTKLKQ